MKKKIVLCEDEVIISLDLKLALRKRGYDVTGVYTSAEEALRLINKDQPDLVICDLKLSGKMNGIEFAEILIKNYSIKVILISGEVPFSDNPQLKFIAKPFSIGEIVNKISSILNNNTTL